MDPKGQLLCQSFVDKAKLKRKQALISFVNARKRSLAPSAKRAKIPGGFVKCCSDGKAVVENCGNFRKSGIPARVMYFCEGDWTDFRSEIAVLLKQAFQGGKTAVEVAVDGVSCLIDFLCMVQIDLKTGAQRSIAWIDVDGKCFFPRTVCDGMGELSSSSVDLEIDLRFHGADHLGVENCKVVTDRDAKSVQVEDSLEQGSSDSCVGDSEVSLVKESRHNTEEHLLMPTSAWMSFPRLFSVIEKFLSSSSISLMKKHYADSKEGKISREDLIRRLRMIAGDRLLISAIKMFRGQVHPSMNEKMSPGPKN